MQLVYLNNHQKKSQIAWKTDKKSRPSNEFFKISNRIGDRILKSVICSWVHIATEMVTDAIVEVGKNSVQVRNG